MTGVRRESLQMRDQLWHPAGTFEHLYGTLEHMYGTFDHRFEHICMLHMYVTFDMYGI